MLWGDQFIPQPSESAKDTVKRCYPRLIAHRKKLYERYSQRIVPTERLRWSRSPTARGFLELLESQARIA